MSRKTLRLALFIIIASVIAGGVYLIYTLQQSVSINSYDECVAAGNPVLESFPEQCAANGRLFTNQ